MMRRSLALCSAVLGLWTAASAALAASPAIGLWKAPRHDAIIELYDCGPALCGRVVTSDMIKKYPTLTDLRNKDLSLRNRPAKNLVIITGFVGGPPEWTNGKVYNPEDGNTYRGTIKITTPTTLKLTGCVIFPLCQSQTWVKAE